jgi:heterodisulfide reductase subunit B2
VKYAYYPGCSLSATGVEYNMSTLALAHKLGVELLEIPQWNCCGASYSHNRGHLFTIALPARNLALAERENLEVAVSCAACYNKMKGAREAVKSSPGMKEKINRILKMEYNATYDVLSSVEVFGKRYGLNNISARVTKPLTGLRVASYYGCLLVRPPQLAMDDQENPCSIDDIIGALGGTAVDWTHKVECCGAFHSTYNSQAGFNVIGDILAAAADSGADCIAVACPLCMLNLDMRQANVNKQRKTNYRMPIFYFTELMGLAVGILPKELGIQKHFVNPGPLLRAKALA